MKDFIVCVVLSLTIIYFVFSLFFFLLEDVRTFHTIKEQCQTNGFIQNKTVRINCSLEKPQ